MSTFVKWLTVPANDKLRVYIPGSYFMLMETAYGVNLDLVRNNTRFGSAEGVEQGFCIGPVGGGFHGVEIASVNAAAQDVMICISDDPIDYRRITGTVKTSPAQRAAILTWPDVVVPPGVATVLLGANSSRSALHMQCTSTVRWGDGSVGVARGVEVAAGLVVVVESTDAVWVYSAAGCTVSLTEVSD